MNNFKKIDTQDGLADNSVYSILKDPDGFIWFGTGYGLSRYDGKIIRNFLPENHNNITRIYNTSKEMLLFIQEEYLNCFDRYREEFIPIYDWNSGKRYHTKGIYIINDSLYWSISQNELHLLKRIIKKNKSGELISLFLDLKKRYKLVSDKESLNNICLSPDKSTAFLTTTQCELLVFDFKEEKIKFKRHFEYKDKFPIIPTSLSYNNNHLWITLLGKGVIHYNISLNTYKQYSNPPYKKTVLSHNDVYDFIPINGQDFLAATWDGYTIFSPDKTKNDEYSTEIVDKIAYQPYNLETRMISAFYDPQGVIYIGTHGGGVIISNLKEQFYHKYHQGQNNEICGIATDNQKHIWLATFSGEILRTKSPFELCQKVEFESVKKNIIRGENAVLCVLKDKYGNLWFGNSNSSISCYNIEKQKFINYTIPTEFRNAHNSKLSIYVWTLFIDNKDRFWIGTNQGLLLFDYKSGTFYSPPMECPQQKLTFSVRAIAQNQDNAIWLGTPNGLYKLYSTDKQEFRLSGDYEKQKGIEARHIRSLLSATDGHLYIGYTMGLGILSNDTICKFYSTRDGLCSNFIACIAEDAQGHIWLGTNSGISHYNKHQHLFFNYYISGSNRSAFLADETLFWGNNNALTYFNPNDIIKTHSIQKPLLLELELYNKRVEIGEIINEQIILDKGLPYTNKINLKYENRDFSLRFKNLAYLEGLYKYNYRLLPYQKDWLVCDENGKVSYTNLPAGKYTFEVKSIYPEGAESMSNTLDITILPHWSQTWWLKLIICLCIIAIIFIFFQRFKKKQERIRYKLKLEHELNISNIERNNEKRLREEREIFFTNIAHELRTPLTLVLSPLRGLLSRTKMSNINYQTLATMLENGNSLQKLIDNLLYVQKIGAGMMNLKISKVNIVVIVKEIFVSFKELAQTKEIDFSIQSEQENITLWVDMEKMVSAIQNLLSNAFKYTPKNGKIQIKISKNEIDNVELCKIDIKDNGIGIPQKLQNKIFDSFITGNAEPSFSTKIGIGLYIVKNTIEMHHGTILLDSDEGKGSTFTLLIPTGYEHFSTDQCEITPELIEVSNVEKAENLPAEEKEVLLYNYKKYTLLIIEDNPDIRKYIAGIFSKKQYVILEAGNGQEGVEQTRKNMPDLIISDIIMPVKDGIECCREIREEQATAHIPIIMLTAKVEDADIIKSTRIGVDDYMMKPFNPELLIAKVENLLLYREQLKRLYTKALLLKENVPSANNNKQEDDTFMQQVINIIEANLMNDAFGVKMLAEELNISQPTLYRKIKQRSKLSIIEVIRSVRMSKAASLLMEHKYSIQEVSLLVGFTDTNTFRKHFTEQFGVPPSKYV